MLSSSRALVCCFLRQSSRACEIIPEIAFRFMLAYNFFWKRLRRDHSAKALGFNVYQLLTSKWGLEVRVMDDHITSEQTRRPTDKRKEALRKRDLTAITPEAISR
jgi:hypothetical protein